MNPGSTKIPADESLELAAHCKSVCGAVKAIDLLKQNGFKELRNMKGGILAWSDQVDPSVPKY